MKNLGFSEVVDVAIGADLCTIEEAKDFLEEVPAKQPWMGTSCCPAWSVMAKKLEANRKSVRSDVDFVLTFEELQGMFDAKDIDFATIEPGPDDNVDEGTGMGRGFAVGGGVAAAVVEAIKHMDPDREVKIEYGDGLRECRKMLAMAKAGKRDGYLLEGMACPGGCVAGAGTIQPVKQSAVSVEKFKNDAAEMSCTVRPHLHRLEEVEERGE